MTYDEGLAQRTRAVLATLADADERKMFGGLAFMVHTHMACGIVGNDLMVRVGTAGHEAALERGAREMDFTGRPMRGLVLVPAQQVADDAALVEWCEHAVCFARSEPPKPPRAPKASRMGLPDRGSRP